MNGIKTFTITSETYYDPFIQQYRNILTINVEPLGPLRKFVRRLNNTTLSIYDSSSSYGRNRNMGYNDRPHCRLAIVSFKGLYPTMSLPYAPRYPCRAQLMTPDEITDLISWLLANGYQIETQITNMLNQSELKLNNQKVAFTATYYGNKQPNIVYSR